MNTNIIPKTGFVSIIIPTYNREKYLGITIDSFINQTYPSDKYEIIICDNNSTDGTSKVIDKYVSKYGNDRIKHIFEARQGVHYARNVAAKKALGEILYFTDDDMIADKKLLETLISYMDKHKNVGCATGRILPKWEETPPKWIVKYCFNSLLSLNDLGKRSFMSCNDMGVFSCHEAITRQAFFETGGFHPENTAGEWIGDGETGLNQDIKKNGYAFAYVGTSLIFHMIPKSRMTQKYLNKRLENTGNCLSYTEFRKNKYEKRQLIGRVIKYILQYILKCFAIIYETILGENSFRFIISYYFFYRARIKYDYKVLTEKKFRDMVLEKNWL